MKEKLLAIAEQYQLDEFQSQIKEILALNSIKIAFLGAFSAGKTSLINALLGLKLPESPKPTTKSICLIEPDESVDSNEYFEDCGLDRQNISFMDFQNLLNGDRNGVAGVRIKPSEVLPLGSVFIDTPGIDNTGSSEGDLTTAYLQFVDAAVICIDVKEGTVRNHILQYLQRPELELVREKMIFVLTYADPDKGENAYDRVVQEVARQLENGLQITDAKNKIIAIETHKPGVVEKFESLLQRNVLAKRNNIIEKRIEVNLKLIAQEMLKSLKIRKENLKLDNDGVSKKIADVRKAMDSLEEEKYKHRNDMCNLEEELRSLVAKKMKTYATSLAVTESEDVAFQTQEMMNSINELCQNTVNRYIKGVDLDPTLIRIGMDDVVNSFKSVDGVKNVAVTVGTGILMAYIGPAAGLGNAAEAAVGGGVQKIAKEGAKKTVEKVAKETAKEVAKNVGKKAFLGVALKELATVIKNVNPVELLGTYIASKVKESSFESVVADKAKNIAQMVVNSVQVSFENQVLNPIETQLASQMNALEKLREERKNNEFNFEKEEDALDASIKELKAIA
ncbi:MAG: dynamin family protein [Fibrobacter sp.]|nr:dynamin family protein [Fibrobacter sp.]